MARSRRRGRRPGRKATRQKKAGTTELAPAASADPAGAGRTRWLGVALLVASTILVFGSAVGHEFLALDDPGYYTKNPYLDGHFGLDDVRAAFTETYMANWTPVTSLSIAIGDALHGPDPAWVLATNLLLHALAAVLLFLAMLRLTHAPWASVFVAAVFAVHPLQVEVVAWASQRKDVLAGVFWMGALWAYAAYAEQRTPGRYALVFACATLALLSKPVAVTLPFVLLLLDFWPLRRFGPGCERQELRAVVAEKLPMLALVVLASFATLHAQSGAGATAGIEVPFGQRLANAAESYAVYLVDSFWPARLAPYYPYPLDGYAAGRVAASVSLLALATAFCIGSARRRPALCVGWLWFVGTLVPMIGLVQVGTQARADRYMYLPLVGIALMVAFGPREVWRRLGKAGVALGVVAVLALAVLARAQVAYWKDTRTLFTRALGVTSANYVAHQMVGNEDRRAGNLRSAEHHLREAWRIRPESSDVPIDLAAVLIDQGRTGDARRELERARKAGVDSADLHFALGVASEREGRDGDAIASYRRALERDPDLREAENNLAWLLATSRSPALREPEMAIRLAERVATRSGDDPAVLDTLAAAYAAAGRWDDAVSTQTRALDALPADADPELRADLQKRLERYRARRSGATQESDST